MNRCAVLALLLVGTGGCNLVFGLEPPAGEAPAIDAVAADDAVSWPDAAYDAELADGSPIDGLLPPIDAALPPIDAPPLPIDAPPPPCTPVDDGNECTFDLCANGVPVNPPRPRDTFCNGFDMQCDGAGNCVDCTNSGGCGECCVCLNQVCIPA